MVLDLEQFDGMNLSSVIAALRNDGYDISPKS